MRPAARRGWRSAAPPALRRAHQQHAFEAQGHHRLLVEAGQAALERLGQPALLVRHHDRQRLDAAAPQPGRKRRQLRRLGGPERAFTVVEEPWRFEQHHGRAGGHGRPLCNRRNRRGRNLHRLDARQSIADRLAREHVGVVEAMPPREAPDQLVAQRPGGAGDQQRAPRRPAIEGPPVRGLQGLERVWRHPSMLPSATSNRDREAWIC